MRREPSRTLAGLGPALLALAALLGGCLGGPAAQPLNQDPAPSATPTLFNSERGALVGRVVTPEQLPVAGAFVELLDQRRSTLTNRDGFYNFSLLAPGLYRVQARVGSNEPVLDAIYVPAAALTNLDFEITITAPVRYVVYNKTEVFRGYITCNWRGEPCPGYDTANDQRFFEHHFEGEPVAFMYELVWERRGPPWLLPEDYFRENGFPGGVERWQMVARLGDHGGSGTSSPSYVFTSFNFTDGRPLPEGPVQIEVKSFHGGGFTLPGLAYESPFDLYATTFYAEDQSLRYCAAPPEYCAERGEQGYL